MKGLGPVFAERLAPGIAAPAVGTPQVVEHGEMLAPQLVERVQHDELLHVPDGGGAESFILSRHPSIGDARDTGADFGGGDPILLRPFRERQRQRQNAAYVAVETSHVPLLWI